ncbi:MAG: M48 family metallopeptidase [Sedimentisphaerales bacterium]
MTAKLRLLILSLALCLSTGCAVNPITGEEELMFISENQDIEIGREYAPEIEKQLGGKIDNPSLQNYIDSVGQRIVRISHRPDWEYHFTAVEHKMVNAVALPGGHVFVTKGMLEKLTTEAQLAALLAHEIVHITARHSSAAISRQMGLSFVLFGLSAAAGANIPQDAARAAGLALQLIGLKYSRVQERQADVAGLDYMVVAGYNPYGAVELMQMLEDQDKVRPVEFLSSHPSPENRIIYLNARIQTRYDNPEGLRIGKNAYRSAVLDHLPDDPSDKSPPDHLTN